MVQPQRPKIGGHLLEIITKGMYSDERHCIREYIQNAYDSIRSARRDGILSRDEGQIDITIDADEKSLKVCDNGTGMSPEAASVHLIDIGASSKGATELGLRNNAGFRGIGRLAGISYCKRLHFITSDGNSPTVRVVFEAAHINKATTAGSAAQELEELIKENCQFDDDKSINGKRFFEVILEGVTDEKLLDPKNLKTYLEQTAPVPCDSTQWKYQGEIFSFSKKANCIESLETVGLSLCNPSETVLHQIYRPFYSPFETRDGNNNKKRTVAVTGVEALPLSAGTDGYKGWWGWFATHERRGQLADIPFAGLRIRMHNIAVGDHTVMQELWPYKPLAKWCFGEIHITDPEVVPKADRSDFEPTPAWERIRGQLKAEAKALERKIRKENENLKSSPAFVAQRAHREVTKAQKSLKNGFASPTEKSSTLNRLKTQSNNLEQKLKKKNSLPSSDMDELSATLNEVKTVIDDVQVSKTKADDSTAHMDRKAKRAVRTVLEVVRKVIKNESLYIEIERSVYEALQPEVAKPKARSSHADKRVEALEAQLASMQALLEKLAGQRASVK